MENLDLYNKVRSVPENAQKPIEGGRLKGKTDINPMWRFKTLTEQFGVCGIGWRYEIVRLWTENGANNEIAAFAQINLYIKQGDIWSEAIQGIGGNMFVEKEKAGLHTSDECYKMALTDAISVACKALGVGADIYWEADRTKYSKDIPQPQKEESRIDEILNSNLDNKNKLAYLIQEKFITQEKAVKALNGEMTNDIPVKTFIKLFKDLLNENQG